MFEVIGERINTSRKLVQAAVAERDAAYIIDDVKKQQEAGADCIDVNVGARIDPLDQKIMATIRTADMLLSHDDFCMNYLKEVRSGAIKS
ncbi:MAG: hypothetical protein JRC87_07435 [Deltaproteobacteria bacterium]|nr:hypothetical protein [Deltaproteobacteria bacterium]